MKREEIVSGLREISCKGNCVDCCVDPAVCNDKLIRSAADMLAQDATNNVATKAADEMFAALGFTKNTSLCYGEDKDILLYEKSVMNDTDILQVYFNNGDVTYWNNAGHALWMQKDILKAILKKMEEMGWD